MILTEESSITDPVRPLCQRALLEVIRDAGIKYTTKVHQHECPIHTRGRVCYEVELNKFSLEEKAILQGVKSEQKLSLAEKTQLSVLREKKNAATECIRTYDRHIERYTRCRAFVHKVEDDLKVGECVVYRDFVSQYLFVAELLGDKMNNLTAGFGVERN